MTFIYFLIGGAILFFLFLTFGYQFLAYKLLGDNLKPIDEEQKNKCHEMIDKGEAPSRMCKYYLKKGFCPDGKCKRK